MSAGDARGDSSRVEREILEILERADAPPAPVKRIQIAAQRQRASIPTSMFNTFGRKWSTEIGKIAGALLLAIAAATIADHSRLLGVMLAIASAVIFFSLWFPGRPSGWSESPRWRGRDLRDSPRSSPSGLGWSWPWRRTNPPPRR